MIPLPEVTMSEEMMNTKGVAAYLGINEKQVYALIKAGRIPGTRVTGKWVFPKKLVDEWIETGARSGLKEAREKSRDMEGALLASGSNDPVLDFLLTGMRHTHPEFYFFCANTGSTEGLKALGGGYTDIAWTHLFDQESGRYNVPFLPKYLPDMKTVLVHLFRREIGIVAAPGNPLGIASWTITSVASASPLQISKVTTKRFTLMSRLGSRSCRARPTPASPRWPSRGSWAFTSSP
jgi:putative molybdopterin biosynthesis protein